MKRELDDCFECSGIGDDIEYKTCIKNQINKAVSCQDCGFGLLVRKWFKEYCDGKFPSDETPVQVSQAAGRRTVKEKTCTVCQRKYEPGSNRQEKCPQCKDAQKPTAAKPREEKPAKAPKHDKLTPKAKAALEAMHRQTDRQILSSRGEQDCYCVSVDFAQFPHLHKCLLSLAADEFRTPEAQLMCLLRNTLKNMEAQVPA